MAVIPLSGTNIHFLKGIPFSNDYKHSRWFDTSSEQTTYFLNKPRVHSMSQAKFQHIEDKDFIRVDQSIDLLRDTNYVMFQNEHYSNKWFYAFVVQLERKNNSVTNVHVQLDVLQTWRFDMNFQPSFVVREHQPLWNADGTPVINTVDEGLNYGTDYETVSIDNYKPYGDVFFLVIACKSAVHSSGITQYNNAILPSINGVPQPLVYYVHPFRIRSGGVVTQPNVTVSGENANITDIVQTLENIFKMDSTVNNVASLYITEYLGDNSITYDGATDTINFSPSTNYNIAEITSDQTTINTVYMANLESYDEKSIDLGGKYNDFHSVEESKLLMHPYTVTILDDFKGNRIELKNEYIQNPNINVSVKGSIGTSNKTAYYVNDYLNQGLSTENKQLNAMEYALLNTDPNDLPILADYLSAYIQGNRNSIQTQLKSAQINGIMNLIGTSVGGVGSALTRNALGGASSATGVVQGALNMQLQVEGINSKIQDISNVPPNLNSRGGNTPFDYGNGYQGVYVMKKQITSEYRKKLTDYFNMFGYKTNETKVPNFHTRQHWNYVQTLGCVILADINNEDLQELKNVFDKGITLWHSDNVGNYELENVVI